MTESGYYPPGAEFHPDAPWNEEVVPNRIFKVCVSQTISKNTTVNTNDYHLEIDDEDNYPYADTSDTNWVTAYSNDHYTPLELIRMFKKSLEYARDTYSPNNSIFSIKQIKHLISECEGWMEDDYDIIEE